MMREPVLPDVNLITQLKKLGKTPAEIAAVLNPPAPIRIAELEALAGMPFRELVEL